VQTISQEKVNVMPSSTRSEKRTLATPDEDVTTAKAETTLDLGHARLASECWGRLRGSGSGTRSNVMAAPKRPALRFRRHPPQQHIRRCPRPSQPAEARFTPEGGEFLTQ
jgi:hypothetical protein